MPTLDDLRKTRIEKLQELKKMGIDPYPSRVIRDQTIAEAKTKEGEDVSVVGRITGRRGHGKICFFDLVDESGQIQIVCKADKVSEKTFALMELVDLGDFLSVQGTLGKTEAGEVSVFAANFQLITKTIRPLPDKWNGLKDIEERYRQRYVDLLMNSEVKNVFLIRTKIIKFLRHYFDSHSFIEVETPILQPIYGGAAAKPFITHHNTLDTDLYLRIAVELYLKRLIIGGVEKVYELGKDFRNEGMDRGHNPEFTMLEFYWAYTDYEKLMQFTQNMLIELVQDVCQTIELDYQGIKLNFQAPWKRITYREAILEHTGVDINQADTEEKLRTMIKSKGIKVDLTGAIGYGAVLDTFYKQTTRPHLVGPLFLTDRPTDFVSLAKRLPEDPRKTASFQLLIAGREIINAYNELNDPIDQANRWKESEKLGEIGHSEHEVFDDDYIRALEYGMPPTAGWGMGIDNLVAILTNQHALKDVILFPTLRPITDEKKEQKQEEVSNKQNNHNGHSTKDIGISYPQAKKLLDEYIKDPITKMHCIESEAIMRVLARHFSEVEEEWGIIGLLHDIDWEETRTNTKLHCIRCADILRKNGGTEFLIKTIQSHGYGQGFGDAYYGPPEFKDKTREGRVQHALAAAETLTGLIVATALIQPDKKLASVKPESLIKKYKSKGFAANCKREIIAECEEINIPIDQFLGMGLKALQDIHEGLGL